VSGSGFSVVGTDVTTGAGLFTVEFAAPVPGVAAVGAVVAGAATPN
jgi:hypothetical protein